MADKKITQLTPIVGADLVSADEFVVVDVSADETKSIVLSELIAGIAALPKSGGAMTGAITTNSTFDGRDVATDGTKLDTIETSADVTDAANVTAAGALMDSELTNIAAVKAINQSLVTTSSPTFDTVNATTLLGDGSGLTGVGGGLTWVRKTSNYTSSNNDAVIADTSGGVWTLTLPALPSVGNLVRVVDGADWATNNLTVARNSSTIEGDAADLVMNIGGVSVDFVYDGTTWQLYIQAGANSGTVVTETDTQTLTNKTLTSPTITSPSITSPTITGTPTVPTATVGTDTTQAASTAFVLANAPASPVKAWVNFNGTGTVAIRASFNVSSITDSGNGTYTINFTTAIEDTNYAVVSSNPVASDNTKGSVGLQGGYNSAATLKTTTQVRIRTGPANGTSVTDFQQIDVAIIR